jgi:hypothetical protein
MNVHEAMKLDDITSRFADTRALLHTALENVNHNQNNAETANLLETVDKMLMITEKTHHNVIGSIGGGNIAYLHDRQQAQFRRKMRDDCKTPLKCIDNFIQSNETYRDLLTEEKKSKKKKCDKENNANGKVDKCKEKPPRVMIVAGVSHLNTRSHQQNVIRVPKPANGHQYTSLEAAEILVSVKSSQPVIDEWVKQNLVPCKKARLYELRSAFRQGKRIR